MISPWVGIGIAIFCGMVGAAVRVFDFTPVQKKVVGWACVGGAIIGLMIVTYGFLVGVETRDVKPSSSVVLKDNQGDSNVIMGDHNTINPKVDPNVPTPLGKYVCTTSLSTETGKHVLLVELGVRHGQTNGLSFRLDLESLYQQVMEWIEAPLRTDRPEVTYMTQQGLEFSEDLSRMSYARSMMSPSLNPQNSYYVYFEAENPLRLKNVSFIEDRHALSDQLRAAVLAKQFDMCPR